MSKALQDHIIEPQRAHLIPGFERLKDAAYTSGALAFGISGAGPALFAFSQNTLVAERVGEAMHTVFLGQKIEAQVYVTRISAEGAELC
jgi:homoserine kinase